jgi:hypothetical protein
MMLAHAEDLNILHEHEIMVVNFEYRIINDLGYTLRISFGEIE